MSVLLVALLLLACWRLGRLAAVDQITQPLRDLVIARSGPGGKLTYLVTCSWCISMWTSVPLVAVTLIWPTNRAVWGVLLVLTGSLASGFGQTVEDKLDA